VKFLAYSAGTDWVSTEASQEADEQAKVAAAASQRVLDQVLLDLLSADNLVVLCGLGTSLCVKDTAGQALAPSMAVLWQAAADQAGEHFVSIKTQATYTTPQDGDSIELLLSRCQMLQHIQPSAVIEKFIADTEKLIVHKCRFIKQGTALPVHEAFLRKAARRSPRKPRMRLFTTNYDTCFETAASRTGYVVVDGFSYALPQEFDGIHFSYDFVRREPGRDIPNYIQNVFHLYKVHGSVTWEREGPRIKKSPEPPRPLIIYPRDSKFESSYDQPFIEMMAAFQMALRQPNTGLLVIGVGLSDRHLTEPMMSAIRSNASLRAVFVAPNLEASTRSTVKDIAQLIVSGDSRLVLAGGAFEDLVAILPSLTSDTEEEQHAGRVRNLPARG
jgi:hypothetical protein